MIYINKVVLIGRLTKDIELRYTQDKKAVAKFTLAVNRIFKQEGQPQADYINIIVFGTKGESDSKYLRKSSKVAISGRIQTRSYEVSDGSKRYVTEVVGDEVEFLDNKASSGQVQESLPDLDFTPIAECDDDLPF